MVYNGYEDIEIEDSPHWECTVEDVLQDLFETKYSSHDYSDMNKGLRIIQSKNAEKFCEIAISKLSEQLEKIFETYSQHKLQCDGVFSNGEAIYSEIKD